MAVKKVVKAEETKKEDVVVTTPEVEVETPVDTSVESTENKTEEDPTVVAPEVETSVETASDESQTQGEDEDPEVSAQPEVEVPEVEVETPVETSQVDVDTQSAVVDTANKPEGKVKVRMRADHNCHVGQDFYELKAGQCYVIPESVKKRLNKAGLLSPL